MDKYPYGSFSSRLNCDCVFCERDRIRTKLAVLKALLQEVRAILDDGLMLVAWPSTDFMKLKIRASALLSKIEAALKR